MPSGPKSNKFVNRHAAEAMERDQERKTSAAAAAAKAKEDAMWEDNDAKTLKKLEREREAQAKAAEYERRRAEGLEQLASEEKELQKNKLPPKVTKKMMQREVAKLVASYDSEVAKVRGGPEALPETPPSHIHVVDAHATGVTAALSALSEPGPVPDDRHIGKRAKVLYRQFCAEHTAEIKSSHPSLRRSQLNDLLWEAWQRSPQNPFVLRSEARNAERLAEERRWLEGGDEDETE